MDNANFVKRGNKLFIGGLPDDVTEDDILVEFSQCGKILDIVKVMDGYFCIEFEKFSEAAAAEKYLKNVLPTLPVKGNFADPMMAMPMNPMMNAMAHMPPMMNMWSPMAAFGSPHPIASWAMNRSPPMMDASAPNFIRVTTNGDSPRSVATSPMKPGRLLSEENENVRYALETGPCISCQKRTSYTCGRCGGFYCSRECQRKDWADHKTKCNNELPPLNFAGKKQITEVELVTNNCEESGSRPQRSSPQGPHGRDQRDAQDHRGQRDGFGSGPSGGKQNQEHREGALSVDQQNRKPGGAYVDDHQRNRMQGGNFNQSFGDQRNDSSGVFPGDRQNRRQGAFPDDGQRNRMQGALPDDFQKNRMQGVFPDDGQKNRMQGNGYNQRSNGQRFGNGGPRNHNNGGPRNQDNGENRNGRRDGDRPNDRKPGSYRGAFNFHEGGQKDQGGQDIKDSCSPPQAEVVDSPVSVDKVEPPPEVKEPAPVTKVNKLLAGLKLNHAAEECSEPTATVESTQDAQESQPKLPESRTERPPPVGIVKGEEVLVSHVTDNSIYIRSMSKLSELATLVTAMQKQCSGAPTLTRQPKKKEYLAAKFSADGNFYRAIVEARTDKQVLKYRVRFIDFGNDEDGVTCDKMALLPDDLASLPCMAIETHLDGVPREPLTKEAVAILNKYLAEETPLKLEFLSSITDGVTLKTADGSTVNEKVLKLLTAVPAPIAIATPPALNPAPVILSPPTASVPASVPSVAPALIKIAPEPSQRFTYDDVENVPFPPPGSKVATMINHVQDVGLIMACPAHQDVVQAAADLNVALQSYAPSAQPFRPEQHELCVAKWTDDSWYRAVCVEKLENDTFQLLFLEYGNVDNVKYPNIVPVTEKIAKEKALSSMCQLSGPSLTPEQINKLKDLTKPGWCGEAIVESIVEGVVVLDIPALRKML